MTWLKVSSPVLGVFMLSLYVSTSYADDSCKHDTGFVVKSQKEADTLAKCKEFTGDVSIAPTASGNITIDGLETLHGTLSTTNSESDTASLLGIESQTLVTVDGALNISSVASLQSIVLSSLRTVKGEVEFSHLPQLVDLQLQEINSIANFKLLSAQNLKSMDVGKKSWPNQDPNVGLKHITSETNPSIQVKDVGIEHAGGLMDLWNASLVEFTDNPNLNILTLVLERAKEVHIRGNGEMHLSMLEGGWTDAKQPIIEKLAVSGIKHIAPCLNPDVWEFIAVNNTVEYLHFGFEALRRLEVRENPNMKLLSPWNGGNLWEWNLTDILIKDNPQLSLARNYTRSPQDNLTNDDCPSMFESNPDEWVWYPFQMNSLEIQADIDNSFFSSFVELWDDSTRNTLPTVLNNFTILSSDPSFDCSPLYNLRSKTVAFQGYYSCQGETALIFNYPPKEEAGSRRLSVDWRTVAFPLATLASVLLI